MAVLLDSQAIASNEAESIPQLKNRPSGTSLISCWRTALRARAETCSTASSRFLYSVWASDWADARRSQYFLVFNLHPVSRLTVSHVPGSRIFIPETRVS